MGATGATDRMTAPPIMDMVECCQNGACHQRLDETARLYRDRVRANVLTAFCGTCSPLFERVCGDRLTEVVL
jgi:hypothetical protein